ncbi:MAG TPA: hypothetical protein VE545_03540 [Candidatus Dormibacteraeota bacterium]|nr:hypothetical protein [Candidatus Dormibacteraeota bacterium]
MELNGDLRHAHSELQSAHRAAERLRVRFTLEEIAQHAEADLLTTAQATASGLHEYFSSIPRPPIHDHPLATSEGPQLNDAQVLDAIVDIAAYMREQRDRFLPLSEPLPEEHLALLRPFFSPTLLRKVRVVLLAAHGLSRADVHSRAHGYQRLLDFTHMASVTFDDVVVVNETLTTRLLFHALVHAVQFQLLGLQRYTELFVRTFVTSRWRFKVPLEAHAFELEGRFAADLHARFLVEDEVRLWIDRERY